MLINILWVYIAYAVCRCVYLFENWNTFSGSMTRESLVDILRGGFLFDTSAIVYTNALYVLMMLLPLHYKEHDVWQKIAKWVYMIFNSICIIVNIADAVYFQYTGRRTTATIFSEFRNEDNLASIFTVELMNHWYLVLLAVLMIWLLYRFYVTPKGDLFSERDKVSRKRSLVAYYVVQVAMLLVGVPLCVCGMRGGFTTAVRPITVSNANQYVDRPSDAALVLNTPFALIRTVGKDVFVVPEYMSETEMEATYSPEHHPQSLLVNDSTKKNVVILMVESMGREYVGALNKTLEGGAYSGYTPFLDSLIQHSVTFKYSYSNGRKSIDGMPSVLSGIPMFVEPFFLTPSSMNDVSGVAGELGKIGYYSAFFHGADNNSMGFQAFARASGFQDYFGRTEYNEDKRFNGDADFDGTWAIWDEPFLQFYALKMGEFSQPFVSAVFTASSHHPFAIPESYHAVYKEESLPIHKCVRYTDNALRKFFETAKSQPWYDNTVFVITADHTNMTDHAYYQTDLGRFCVPIIFYDPKGFNLNYGAEERTITPGIYDAIAQQIDIMPTVLGYVGYNQPFVSFGCDLFATPADSTWAVSYMNGIYQYVQGDYLLHFDGSKSTGLYAFRTDSLLQDNLLSSFQQPCMEQKLKAIIQQYMGRMIRDELVVRHSSCRTPRQDEDLQRRGL